MDNLEAPSGSESGFMPEHEQVALDMQLFGQSQVRDIQTLPPRGRHCLLLPVAAITMFLALVNIAAGMTAREGDPWKLTFMGSVSLFF